MTRLVAALLLILASAVAIGANFDTKSWESSISVEKNHIIAITETISVHFKIPQHGIFRKIPARTASATQTRDVRYELVSVVQNGAPATVKTYPEGGDWVVRIGRGDATVNGDVTYVITYKAYGAITSFNDHAELFWNAIPTGWSTPIGRASVVVQTPPPTKGEFKARILAGQSGSRWGLELSLNKPPVGDTQLISGKLVPGHLTAEIRRELPLGHGVTVVVALPSGTLDAEAAPEAEPSYPEISESPSTATPSLDLPNLTIDPTRWTVGGILPIIGLPFLFWWMRSSRKPQGPLVVQFEPPSGIDPSMAGLLIDGRVDRQDIVAGIVEVARKGGFRLIRANEGTTIQILEKPPRDRMSEFDLQLYHAMAAYKPEVTSASLRGVFGTQYNLLKGFLSRTAASNHWLRSSGSCVIGCLFVLGTLALGGLGLFLSPCIAPLVTIVALPVGLVMASKVGQWSEAGAAIRDKLLGLREFITRANEMELDYMSRINPTQALFEELLPFAIAFGTVKQWSQAFAGIELQPPTWYDGYDRGDAMWTALLVNDLMVMNDSYGDAMAYTPPTSYGSGSGFSSSDSGFGGGWDSGGGGFSGGGDVGGGGGGGGGDSW